MAAAADSLPHPVGREKLGASGINWAQYALGMHDNFTKKI
jgi:hypothetical protein